MRSIISIVVLALSPAAAFQPFPSSFAGRASCVCSRAELSTELSCPPGASGLGRRGTNMSMPPFLKKLGLKKPGGDNDEQPEANTAVAFKGDDVDASNAAIADECEIKEEKELTEAEKLLKQVKESGTAGIISYALWELAFWILSIPVCLIGYYEVFGHMPDFSNQEDLAKLGGEAFAFVNFARFAVPLRIGLALSTTPWINENLVEKFKKKDDDNCVEPRD
mmetsp:Transcript_355/g.336  ORF Transcript_355/g.336 Transcript_355/m.336 type:complete len:222 (-) Transcript_355:185-850(-)